MSLFIVLGLFFSSATATNLTQTQEKGFPIQLKYIDMFIHPQAHTQRLKAVNLYFKNRFGISDIFKHEFRPQAIVLHSTETHQEAGVYGFFNSDTSEYLGGVWTHFSVDANGTIRQYAPLNRVSKGQAGLNDIGVGIELIGFASTYAMSGKKRKVGTIISRYESGQKAQLEAAIDLVNTLMTSYGIPLEHVYSHQDLAHIRDLNGDLPDYSWLKEHIHDRVYLGKVADLDANGKPMKKYNYLEPYGRFDPGWDVMSIIYQNGH